MTICYEILRYYAREGCFKLNRNLTETATTPLCCARVTLPVPTRIIPETNARQKASQKVLDESVS